MRLNIHSTTTVLKCLDTTSLCPLCVSIAVQYVMASMAEIVSLNASTASVSSLGKNARFVFQHVRVAYNDHEGNFLGNEE